LNITPGKTIEYPYIADFLYDFCQNNNVKKIGFDRWGFSHLKPWLEKAGFTEEQLDVGNENALFVKFGQGYESMSPALRDLESDIAQGRLAHGDHPILNMCMLNAVVLTDHALNKKLSKKKARGRIDGAVALVMARGVAATHEPGEEVDIRAMVG
jgi:phage terminase large subunit-like protein